MSDSKFLCLGGLKTENVRSLPFHQLALSSWKMWAVWVPQTTMSLFTSPLQGLTRN